MNKCEEINYKKKMTRICGTLLKIGRSMICHCICTATSTKEPNTQPKLFHTVDPWRCRLKDLSCTARKAGHNSRTPETQQKLREERRTGEHIMFWLKRGERHWRFLLSGSASFCSRNTERLSCVSCELLLVWHVWMGSRELQGRERESSKPSLW